MKFNFEKCKVMHIGHRNIQYTYEMNGHVLHTVESEKDLGVIIRSDLKASDQCASAYAKASKVLLLPLPLPLSSALDFRPLRPFGCSLVCYHKKSSGSNV